MPELATPHDTSGVRLPPPLYFLVGLIAGFVVQHFYPIHLAKPGHQVIVYGLGGLWIFLGLLLAAWALFGFHRGGTSPFPHAPSSHLVAGGAYRWTRNPMYLALALVSIGIGLLANALWSIVSVPVALALVDLLVVRREERYLDRRFGDAYRAYCSRVRRWI
ncbi:MAG: methyltransferase family protein [Gammaproteobacteria bacterium]